MHEPVVARLGGLSMTGRNGAVWSTSSEQLNANLIKLEAGGTIGQHLNNEVDVLMLVQAGSGIVTIDGTAHDVDADSLVLIPRGCDRSVQATTLLVYYSVHQRRGGLSIANAATSPVA